MHNLTAPFVLPNLPRSDLIILVSDWQPLIKALFDLCGHIFKAGKPRAVFHLA